MRVPLPGVTTVCSSVKMGSPEASTLRSSASIGPALSGGMSSYTVLPIIVLRSTPRYASAARLT